MAEVETPGGIELVEVPGHGTVTAMQAQAAAEYEAYMERESKRLAEAVENGTLSEEAYKQAVQEMEESLAGLWDGTRSPDWHANPRRHRGPPDKTLRRGAVRRRPTESTV